MVENAEIGSETSPITKSAKNLSVLVDMAEDAKVDKGDGGNDKTIKRSPLSKKLNILIGCLIFLYFRKK